MYLERRNIKSADYVVNVNPEFGIDHLQTSIMPDTVSNYEGLILHSDVFILAEKLPFGKRCNSNRTG